MFGNLRDLFERSLTNMNGCGLVTQASFGGWGRCARKVVGIPRSTQTRPLINQSPTDPDRWLSTHLRLWKGSACNSRKGYRRTVLMQADLHAEVPVVNPKKVQRISCEEGL